MMLNMLKIDKTLTKKHFFKPCNETNYIRDKNVNYCTHQVSCYITLFGKFVTVFSNIISN